MQDGIPESFPVDLSRKWLVLAERRKAHLVDLYESGRWRLYYDEAEFVSRLREVVREIDLWSATERASLGVRGSSAADREPAFNRASISVAAANGATVNGRICFDDGERGAPEID
jgi:uncharacterized repeat protein (TIGR03809 family)